jgi:hypothetical protein
MPDQASESPRWTLAPIRWLGSVSLLASTTNVEGEPQRHQFSEVVQVNAATYIWQPWFAQVAAGAGLLLDQARVADDQNVDPGNQDRRGGGTRALIGNFALNVFPMSRFPFQFTADVNDSRATGDFIGSDYRSTRIGLRQSYRTVPGDIAYSLGLENSTLQNDSIGTDRVTTLDALMTKHWEAQRLQISAGLVENARSSDDLGLRTARLGAQHSYRPDEFLSVESLATLNHEKRRLAVGSTEFNSDLRQVSTFVNWRTDWDEPLIVLGTARLLDASNNLGDSSASSRLANATGSASYRFSRNLNVFGAASISQLDNEGSSGETLTTQSAGLQYQIDPILWGPVTYSANSGLAAANQTGGQLGARQIYSAQLGHRIAVQIGAGNNSAWTFSLGQDGSANEDSRDGSSRSLLHSASAGWRYSPPSGLAGYVSLSASDSRTFGLREGDFRLLNLQVSGQFRPGPFSFFNANFTAQATRQRTVEEPERKTTRSISGGASYQHVRVFGVPRLRYLLQYTVYNVQFDRRLQGDPNAPRENVNWLIEQRLDYQIGQLDTRLTARWAEVDGKKNASFIGSVIRRFGR